MDSCPRSGRGQALRGNDGMGTNDSIHPSSSRTRGSSPVPVILAKAGIDLRTPIVRQYSWSKNLLMLKQPAVYILASQPQGTLYIGVTSNLLQRIWQHKSGVVEGFTERYEVDRLVYFEMHTEMTAFIRHPRERGDPSYCQHRRMQIRGWIPACSGMTERGKNDRIHPSSSRMRGFIFLPGISPGQLPGWLPGVLWVRV